MLGHARPRSATLSNGGNVFLLGAISMSIASTAEMLEVMVYV